MKIIPLSPRLKAIASLVPRGVSVADVGTDHGYIPIWLVQSGISLCITASDLRMGPLCSARNTATELELDDRISFVLCDGLEKVPPHDAVIIAGMGGETIAGIIERTPWLIEKNSLLILQPMSKAELLRKGLADQGFEIRSESFVLDSGVIYPILTARAGVSLVLSEVERLVGAEDLIAGDPLCAEFLRRNIEKTERILSALKQSESMDGSKKQKEMHRISEGLHNILRRVENANRK